MKKIAVVLFAVSVALAACHHNKPAATGGDTKPAAGSDMGSAAGSGGGDMGSGAAGGGSAM